jgi:hypothetical protein
MLAIHSFYSLLERGSEDENVTHAGGDKPTCEEGQHQQREAIPLRGDCKLKIAN